MKKKFIGFFVLASFLLIFNTASYASDTDEKSTEDLTAEVLEMAWDEFGLFSFGIGQTDPAITIGMDQTKSEAKLREYLNDNLSEEAKKKYEKIYIFKDDIDKLEKEHQEYLQDKSRP
ncbi:hypothetical protein P8917_09975 [Bacillus atrophaeus]|uniref:hypothetical protein n=1 Tax=Bacillus atrophaeus TaxID=1452 RepID=UPI00227FD2C9|nr:hypothetical protein [Bacillus atrophaeus]MCY8497770.1 hypothetical protein [Bacillus atrophaeus]MCY8814925.1 hypothetical protein [Bacillus atrophaeus]MCY8821573.1 hypothetical protein [Bacillus atrophaeus]MCY8831003.1 hypothetical protein [Bacillus atrophaeus]MCY8835218.1 hypothetical protein [Bacillus atrophaeus]